MDGGGESVGRGEKWLSRDGWWIVDGWMYKGEKHCDENGGCEFEVEVLEWGVGCGLNGTLVGELRERRA